MAEIHWHCIDDNWYAAEADGGIVGGVVVDGGTCKVWPVVHGKSFQYLSAGQGKRAVEDRLKDEGYTIVQKRSGATLG